MKNQHKTFYLLIIFLLNLLFWGCSHLNSSQEKPPKTIILVTLDTLRADHLSPYGDSTINTPNVSLFAKEATLFENAFSTAQNTIPSHATMLTSLFSKDHKVYGNKHKLGKTNSFLPKILKKAGYTTAAFTSSAHISPESGLSQGFDTFDFANRNAGATNKLVFQWLKKNKDHKFFLWVHYFDPHMPYLPPEPFRNMYTLVSNKVEEGYKITAFLKEIFPWYFEIYRPPDVYRNLYKGEVSYLDSQLGELFSTLKQLKLYHKSDIILVADHGEALGEKGLYFEHDYIYNSVVKIPLLIKLKGQKNENKRKHLVSTVDLYPTILDRVNITPISRTRGHSLVELIRRNESPALRTETYYQYGAELVGFTNTHHSYLRDVTNIKSLKQNVGRTELYSNEHDPLQSNNIIGSNIELSTKYNQKVVAFIEDTIDIIPKAEITNDPKRLDQLKALGYIK